MSTNKSKKKTKTKSKKKKDEYYVNGKEFAQAIEVYYDSGSDIIPDILAIYIKKIADGLSYAPNFINYSYKEDMVGDAIVKMLSAIRSKRFDLTTGSNPFSYFTTIAFHAFINRIKKEKKQREVISEYQESVYQELMNTEVGETHRRANKATSDNDE